MSALRNHRLLLSLLDLRGSSTVPSMVLNTVQHLPRYGVTCSLRQGWCLPFEEEKTVHVYIWNKCFVYLSFSTHLDTAWGKEGWVVSQVGGGPVCGVVIQAQTCKAENMNGSWIMNYTCPCDQSEESSQVLICTSYVAKPQLRWLFLSRIMWRWNKSGHHLKCTATRWLRLQRQWSTIVAQSLSEQR